MNFNVYLNVCLKQNKRALLTSCIVLIIPFYSVVINLVIITFIFRFLCNVCLFISCMLCAQSGIKFSATKHFKCFNLSQQDTTLACIAIHIQVLAHAEINQGCVQLRLQGGSFIEYNIIAAGFNNVAMERVN